MKIGGMQSWYNSGASICHELSMLNYYIALNLKYFKIEQIIINEK